MDEIEEEEDSQATKVLLRAIAELAKKCKTLEEFLESLDKIIEEA